MGTRWERYFDLLVQQMTSQEQPLLKNCRLQKMKWQTSKLKMLAISSRKRFLEFVFTCTVTNTQDEKMDSQRFKFIRKFVANILYRICQICMNLLRSKFINLQKICNRCIKANDRDCV